MEGVEDEKNLIRTFPILMYHSISELYAPYSVSAERFREQMKWLKQVGYESISFQELENHNKLPSKPILITFDDGYIDNYTDVFPILKHYNIKATIFIVTGWNAHFANLRPKMIMEMSQSGLIEFGAHTVTHDQLTGLSDSEQIWQITKSEEDLERMLEHSIKAFSYPYGISNDKTITFVRNAGFSHAVTARHGLANLDESLFELPRLEVLSHTDLDQFKHMITSV